MNPCFTEKGIWKERSCSSEINHVQLYTLIFNIYSCGYCNCALWWFKYNVLWNSSLKLENGSEHKLPCIVHNNLDKFKGLHKPRIRALVINTAAQQKACLREAFYSNRMNQVQLCTLVLKVYDYDHYKWSPLLFKYKSYGLGSPTQKGKDGWERAGWSWEGSLSNTQEFKWT